MHRVPADGRADDPGEHGAAPRVVERRLCVLDHPTLAQHAANAVARQTRRGWRLDRPSRAAGLNIDAIIALAMAVDAAANQPAATELLGWL